MVEILIKSARGELKSRKVSEKGFTCGEASVSRVLDRFWCRQSAHVKYLVSFLKLTKTLNFLSEILPVTTQESDVKCGMRIESLYISRVQVEY